MATGENELRLLWAVLLNGIVLAVAYRSAARFTVGATWIGRSADALLLTFLIQYLSITLPGLLGILGAFSMTLTALLCCAALAALGQIRGQRGVSGPADRTVQGAIEFGACAFAIVYLACDVYALRYQPVIATDALTYHFPVAVHWLGTGRLSLLPTWFFNPANTYSPLAGSAFIAWLMAPQGNDVIARFVQFLPMLLIFAVAAEVGGRIGARDRDDSRGPGSSDCGRIVGLLIALGVVAFRPFLAEASAGKDDLFLTAFFAVAVDGLQTARLREPLGSWRIGIAIGLCLATKYTALLTLPLLLLALDAPRRAGWRRREYAIAMGLILIIVGPWFLRNLLLAGNPLFPLDVRLENHTLLHGLFQARRSLELHTLSGVRRVFAERDYGVPILVLIVLAIGWLAAAAGAGRRLLREPLVRLIVLGPPLGFILFLCLSPFPEVRFVFPAFLLLFLASAIAITTWLRDRPAVQIITAAVVAGACIVTSYRDREIVATFAGISLAIALASVGAIVIRRRFLPRLKFAGAWVAVAAALVLATGAYIYWNAYVNLCAAEVQEGSQANSAELLTEWWRGKYPAHAGAWAFVRQHVPPGATIAYANTTLLYPLMLDQRRPVYVPTRHGVRTMQDLPHLAGPLSGEQIVPAVTDALSADTDPAEWLSRMSASGATFLFVAKDDAGPRPPEPALARANPTRFKLVFEDEHYVVFQIMW